MGSNYFGEPNLGHGRSSSSSSSSPRKGKKSNSDKPKQPQRGLGVAQLEKIRLHNQMGNCAYGTTIPSTPPYPIANPKQQMDIRLQAPFPLSSSSSFSYATLPSSSSYGGIHATQSTPMGMSELERANIRYADRSQLTSTNARWNTSATVSNAPQYNQQPSFTRNLFNLEMEESSPKKKKKTQNDSMSSGSNNSGSSDCQEIDLELRL